MIQPSASPTLGKDIIPNMARESQSGRDTATAKVPVAGKVVRVSDALPSEEATSEPQEKHEDGEHHERENAREKGKEEPKQNSQDESGKDKESGTSGGKTTSTKCLAQSVVAMAGLMLWCNAPNI